MRADAGPPIRSGTPPAGARDPTTGHQCAHCDLPVPAGLVRPGEDKQFCCGGCRAAHAVIIGCGLDQYYAIRERVGAEMAPPPAPTDDFAEFDEQRFAEMYCRPLDDGAVSVELRLEGVRCSACVWLIESLPRILPGVVRARADMARSLARIDWRPEATPLSEIARTLASLGYHPHPARGVSDRELRRREDRRALIDIAVAGAAAGNVMLIAFALYGGYFTGIETAHESLFRWTSVAIGLVAVAWPGRVFLRGALASLRARRPHLDLPIAVALLIGATWGVFNAVRGEGELYFDSLTAVIFLLLAARFLQSRHRRQALSAVELLHSVTPLAANVVRSDGAVVRTAIDDVKPGDVVEVDAERIVPVDGPVVSGETVLDESLLTGESTPVEAGPGRELLAGSVNLGPAIRVRVRAAGAETRVGRLMQHVVRGAHEKTRGTQLADQLALWFVIVSLSVAGVTLGMWLFIDAGRAVDNALALLIVACPCAVGLATPLVASTAIGRAARRGVLIRSPEALEAAAIPGVVYLDKTGTLTRGRPEVMRISGDEDAARLAAALERGASHPIARAIADAYDDPAAETANVRLIPGGGIEGRVEGRAVLVGSPGFVAQGTGGVGADVAAALDEIATDGLTPVVVAVDGQARTVLGLGDALREDAHETVDRLRKLGWRVGILSGDHPGVVSRAAAALGVDEADCLGGLSPQRKLEIVRAEGRRATVVMVGDGVNDAAALGAATLGVAVSGSAEASFASAEACVTGGGLTRVADLLAGAQRTRRAIARTLGVSLCYNGVAASLAMAGLVHPLVAAVVMPLSSATVIFMAATARTFEDEG